MGTVWRTHAHTATDVRVIVHYITSFTVCINALETELRRL